MQRELKVKIAFDADTASLTVSSRALESLRKSIGLTSENADRLAKSFKRIGHWGATIYVASKAFEVLRTSVAKAVDVTINYNSAIEDARIGIASLIAVNAKAAPGVDKFAVSMQYANDVMRMLKKANLETKATLDQLIAGFQSTLGPALAAGMTLKQTVEYTKLMTIAAGAMGVPMDMLAQEMSSVVSATIDMNSVVAKNLGITNEQIKLHKKQGDLFEFLKNRLKEFGRAGKETMQTYSGAMSNLEDTLKQLTSQMTKPIFEEFKKKLISINKALLDNKDAIVAFGKSLLDTMTNLEHITVALAGAYGAMKIWRSYMNTQAVVEVTAYSAALMRTVKSVKKLTVAQRLLNAAMLENPLILAASALYGGYKIIEHNMEAAYNKHHMGIFDVKTEQEAIEKFKELQNQLEQVNKKLQNGVSLWDKLFGTDTSKRALEARKRYLQMQIRLLGNYVNELEKSRQKTKEVLSFDSGKGGDEGGKNLLQMLEKETKIVSDNAYERLVQKYKEMLEKYKVISGAKLKIDKWYYAQLEKLNKQAISQ